MAQMLTIHKIMRYNNRIFSMLLIFNILYIKSNNILKMNDSAWSVCAEYWDILVEPLNN